MNRIAIRRARGLTLIELLVALTLAAMMLAPIAAMLSSTAAAAATAANDTSLTRDVGAALERIAAVVRATAPQLLDPNDDPSRSGNWFDKVSFEFKDGKLIQKGPDGILAEDVTAFSITAPTVLAGQQLVQVSLTLQRGGKTASAAMLLRLGGLR